MMGVLVALSPSFPSQMQDHGDLLPLHFLTVQAGLGSTTSTRHEWKDPRHPRVGKVSPSTTTTGSPGTATYREDLEEVDWGDMATLASLVRWQRHRDIFQVLREQNYDSYSPRRRENQTMRQSGC